MNRLLSFVVVAAVAAAGLWYLNSSRSVDPAQTILGAQAQSAEDVDTSIVPEISIGNPNSPVTVTEYASYTCPHCRSFHEGAFKDLKAEYIDTGKINFIYREVYFDRFGLWAAMVARCDGAQKYFPIAQMIYEKQSEWTQGEPADIAANLRRIGLAAGLDGDTLEACLTDATMAQAMFAKFQQTSEADDVSGTPTFLIDGQKVDNAEFQTNFRSILDAKIGG